MKNLLKILPLVLAVVILSTACGAETYESIYEDYSAKIQEEGARLLKEFNEEAAALGGNVTALAELSTAKTSELAAICTEGTGKMTSLSLKDGSTNECTEWVKKLQGVYNTEAQKIIDAYMSRSTSLIP